MSQVIYIDLDISSGGLGTRLDPYGQVEFTNFLKPANIHTEDTFYLIKGDWDNSAIQNWTFEIAGNSGIRIGIFAWDIEQFGPWRLKNSHVSINSIRFSAVSDDLGIFINGLLTESECFRILSSGYTGNCIKIKDSFLHITSTTVAPVNDFIITDLGNRVFFEKTSIIAPDTTLHFNGSTGSLQSDFYFERCILDLGNNPPQVNESHLHLIESVCTIVNQATFESNASNLNDSYTYEDLEYYLHQDNSDISGYRLLKEDAPNDTETSSSGTGNSGSGEVLIEEFITDINHPRRRILKAGRWFYRFYLDVNDAVGSTFAKVYLYKRDKNGTETVLGNATTTEINTTSPTIFSFSHSILTDTSLDLTDRLVIKVYMFTDSGANRTVTLYYDGISRTSNFYNLTIFDWIAPVSYPTWNEIDLTEFDIETFFGIDWVPEATYYVDINTSNDGNISYDGLTELQPLTFTNFLTYLEIGDNSLFKTKGIREYIPSSTWTMGNLEGSNKIEPWDDLINDEPWRLKTSDINIANINFAYGIIESQDDIGLFGDLDNATFNRFDVVFLKAADKITIFDGYRIFRGSTLISPKELEFQSIIPWDIINESIVPVTWFEDDFSENDWDQFWYNAGQWTSDFNLDTVNGEAEDDEFSGFTTPYFEFEGDFVIEIKINKTCSSPSASHGMTIRDANDPLSSYINFALRDFGGDDTIQANFRYSGSDHKIGEGTTNAIFNSTGFWWQRLERKNGVIQAFYKLNESDPWSLVFETTGAVTDYAIWTRPESENIGNRLQFCWNHGRPCNSIDEIRIIAEDGLPNSVQTRNRTQFIETVIDTPEPAGFTGGYDYLYDGFNRGYFQSFWEATVKNDYLLNVNGKRILAKSGVTETVARTLNFPSDLLIQTSLYNGTAGGSNGIELSSASYTYAKIYYDKAAGTLNLESDYVANTSVSIGSNTNVDIRAIFFTSTGDIEIFYKLGLTSSWISLGSYSGFNSFPENPVELKFLNNDSTYGSGRGFNWIYIKDFDVLPLSNLADIMEISYSTFTAEDYAVIEGANYDRVNFDDLNITNQLAWRPPTWPDYNDPRANFSFVTLTSQDDITATGDSYGGFETGLFGYSRYSSGAFFFFLLENYYVDISTTNDPNTTYDGLDENHPLTYTNFVSTLAAIYFESNFYVKGCRDLDGIDVLLEARDGNLPDVQEWDFQDFGPWRLRCGDLKFKNAHFAGGLIYADDITFENIDLDPSIEIFYKNLFLKSDGQFVFDETDNNKYRGSTFISELVPVFSTSSDFNINHHNFKDCVLDTPIPLNFNLNYITHENCVFTGNVWDDPPYSILVDICQPNWTPPTWPDWIPCDTNARDYYKFTELGEGIVLEGSNEWSAEGYPTGLWGFDRYNVGAFYFDTVFGAELFISQRTDRHIVKSIDASGNYISHFGIYGTPVDTYSIDESSVFTGTQGLNFPANIFTDLFDHIFVCDTDNKRIVKLNSNLTYNSSIDVSETIDRPYGGYFDFSVDENNELKASLYIVGVSKYRNLSLAKIDLDWQINSTNFNWDIGTPVISKYSENIGKVYVNHLPISISKGFNNDIVISNGFDFLKVSETSEGFSKAEKISIFNELNLEFYGHILHSSGNLYLNVRNSRGSKIIKVENQCGNYINAGDTNRISEKCFGIAEDDETNILIYDCAEQRILKFDERLNYVSEVFKDSGDTIQTDAYDILGLASFGSFINENLVDTIQLTIDENFEVDRFFDENRKILVSDVNPNFDTTLVANYQVDFSNSTLIGGSPVSSSSATWLWDFGDGNTSTDFEPSHTYAITTPDYVLVTLIVTVGFDTYIVTKHVYLIGS